MTHKNAILGCGMMGRAHADAWMARPDAKVVAVYGPHENNREALATHTNAKPCSDYREAIEMADIVSICSPVCFHAEQAIAAANCGKHILCEKTLALTLADADAMIAAAQKNNVCLSTAFQQRGLARNLYYRSLVANGTFGGSIIAHYTDIREVRPKLAMHRRSMNNGPIVDMAGHYFDLLRFVTGEEPIRVFAAGHVFGKGKPRLAGIDDLAMDTAVIEVAMSKGSIISVVISWGMPERHPGLAAEMLVGPALTAQNVAGQTVFTYPTHTDSIDFRRADPPGSSVCIHGIAEAVNNRCPPQVTGTDGRIALAVSLAALKSIETGKAVSL